MGKGYEIRQVVREIDYINEQREILKEKEKLLDERLKAIQKECPHAWDYIPDASGGNDDECWCDLCGARE